MAQGHYADLRIRIRYGMLFLSSRLQVVLHMADLSSLLKA